MRPSLHESIGPLPASFPRFRAYFVSYPANHESLRRTLESFRGCDWGEEPVVFVQPEDWPLSMISSSRNYKRALEHAAADGCDFAVLLEDDVRVCTQLRANLRAIPLLRRDQCDHFSLFIPDLIASPWQRQETHLGYRLARPLYSGPDRVWTKGRLWGAQGYVLSRRFILEALKNWVVSHFGGADIPVCRKSRQTGMSCPTKVRHYPRTAEFDAASTEEKRVAVEMPVGT